MTAIALYHNKVDDSILYVKLEYGSIVSIKGTESS
jgi:hypothetical protein